MQNLVNGACQILTEVSSKQQSVQKNFNNLCNGERGNVWTRKYFKGKDVRGKFSKQKFCCTMNNNYQKKMMFLKSMHIILITLFKHADRSTNVSILT